VNGKNVAFVCLATCTLAAAASPLQHPNLLLNRDEIRQIRNKIGQQPWAAALFEELKAAADAGVIRHDWGDQGTHARDAALCYAITGERRYADAARRYLLQKAQGELRRYQQLDVKIEPETASWSPWGAYAWTYDLTYDTFASEERQLVERWLRESSRIVMEGARIRPTTPNLEFNRRFNVGLVGYCLGEKEFIDWALTDKGADSPHRGGFYPVIDSMIRDRHFWGESPIYAIAYDVHAMLALAEAALHYDGTDLYHYVSKQSGGSIKSLIDGYLRMAYPLERTGVGAGSLRAVTFGDGSTYFSPSGGIGNEGEFLTNSVGSADSKGGPAGTGGLSGELEIAYKRYQDPAYAWVLSLAPKRDTYLQYGRATWGYIALTHGEPLPANPAPPLAPSGIYPSQGFAMLRSDESPNYWTSGALTAIMRLGAAIGHGHEDYFSLVMHGKGRLLYPDVNVIQYEPTNLGWTREGIAHSTLLVDARSPQSCEFSTRHDFTPEAKFFAAAGAAFEGTQQVRAVLLTREYMADVFHIADDHGLEHTFDWVLHGIGRLYMGNPSTYRPSTGLIPNYWWIDNEQSRSTGGDWQADWVQHSGGATPGLQAFDKEWFAQTAGVRLTMLAARDTQVFSGDGPMTDGPPHHRVDGNPEGSIPMVVARRTGPATTFAAVHEPYDRRPAIARVRSIAQNSDAVGMAIEAGAFSDRVLVAFAPDKPCTLAGPDGETFVFTDYAYLRLAGKRVSVRGKLSAFKVRSGEAAVSINGEPKAAQRAGEFIVWGSIPGSIQESHVLRAGAVAPVPAEHQAWLHYYSLPEEVHLRAGQEKEIELRVRCVGQGQAHGQLRFSQPKGLSIEPAVLDVPAMADGQERTLRIRVKAAPDAPNLLSTVAIEPVGRTAAPARKLLVSVGVVMTEDRLRPRLSEFVIRAPGYTMRVDEFSGVSYYLLDADGHRRFGRIHNTNFAFGFPGIMRDGKWNFAYRHPARFVKKNQNTLESGCDGLYHDTDARIGYKFFEDRIVMGLIPPTRPDLEHIMWLSNFDALGIARNGTSAAGDWYFFPHPAYRQGVLLTVPGKTDFHVTSTEVHFPVHTGQEVTLQFATEDELRK